MNQYDEDYFERGVESGKSLYSNFRWIPELTIPLAHEIIKILDLEEGNNVLDFGCAKGYLVKALRLLHINACGVDASKYAIEKTDADVADYLLDTAGCIPDHRLWNIRKWDAIIAKDVLEHLSEHSLDANLSWFSKCTDNLFVIVPLGDGEKYNIPSYELDTTHVIRQPLHWWHNKIEEHGFDIILCDYKMGHIKENWIKSNREGNGFFVARKK